jgi:hypothetical protein
MLEDARTDGRHSHVSRAALLERVIGAYRRLSVAQGELLCAINDFSGACPPSGEPERRTGLHSMEVAAALNWSQYSTAQAVTMAKLAVDVDSSLLQAMRAGRLDWAKLRMMSHELDDVEPEHVPPIVAALHPEFELCTVGQLRERLRRLILQVDPVAARHRFEKAAARRRVEHREFANGTSAIGAAYLPTDRAAAAWNHVDQIARGRKAAGDPEQRDLDQLRADVFADLLTGADPDESGAVTAAPRKAVISLRIGLATLACLNDDPALIPGFGPIAADMARQTVRQLGETAQWRFVVEDDVGQAVAEGRLRYRPTVAQRAFIVARDVTCRAPGCRRSALHCDIDHVQNWAFGGRTTVDNLCSLCSFHHAAKHKGGFRLRRTDRGVEWTTPLGRQYMVLPHDAVANRSEYDGALRR